MAEGERYLSHMNHSPVIMLSLKSADQNTFDASFQLLKEELVRSMLNTALKTNTSLAFAVMTGCLRISKESIFTGLNDFRIETILSSKYGEYFGFTKYEVEDGLKTYHLEKEVETITKWYDGYLFGNKNVFNPWSVIQYLYDAKDN
jgi:hypothetical protein